jgi:hypothetical protein
MRASTTRTLRGEVVDETGFSIPRAQVFLGKRWVVIADDSGKFVIPDVPFGAYGVRVRRVGFVPLISIVNLEPTSYESVELIMERLPATTLAPITVIAASERERMHNRATMAGGRGWAERDLASGNEISVREFLQEHAPGVLGDFGDEAKEMPRGIETQRWSPDPTAFTSAAAGAQSCTAARMAGDCQNVVGTSPLIAPANPSMYQPSRAGGNCWRVEVLVNGTRDSSVLLDAANASELKGLDLIPIRGEINGVCMIVAMWTKTPGSTGQ